MNYNFLANIIEKNWFQQEPEGENLDWTFRSDIENLPLNQMEQLLILHYETLEMDVEDSEVKNAAELISSGESHVVKGKRIDLELLFSFFVCITFSEYRIDSFLYHPQEMRFRELNEICLLIGLPKETAKKIHINWHSGIREKVFPVE
jgi:hypothetical protein